MPHESRPAWAQRLTAERLARGWTQQQTTEALRMQADRELPDPSHLLRMWKNWERGKHRPRPEYQRLIAAAFGSVSAAIFGPDAASPAPSIEPAVAMPSSDSTLELVERIRRSDLDRASLDTLTITVERLCSEYAFMPSADLRREGQAWMAKLVQLLDARLTLAQLREVLVLAGWLALLVGCVEYDTKDVRAAEATRRAAASLGQEAGHPAIMAWAQVLVRPHPGPLPAGHRGSPSRTGDGAQRSRVRAARRTRSQGLGTDGRPPPGRARPRTRPRAAGITALPRQPRQPLHRRSRQVRLLRHGLPPTSR